MKYTVGEAPVDVTPAHGMLTPNIDADIEYLTNKYNNGVLVITSGRGKIVKIIDLSTKKPAFNVDPIWVSEDDIPDFLGNDICEKFKKWDEFRKQGIIWYNKHN